MNAYWAFPPRAEEAPPPPRRSEQLRAAARWIGLLADELEALEAGDFPRVRELAAEREKLAAELGSDDAQGSSLPRPLHVGPVTEALSELRRWSEEERRAREELAQLRDGSLPLVRSLPVRTVGGRYQELDSMDSQLNVRL